MKNDNVVKVPVLTAWLFVRELRAVIHNAEKDQLYFALVWQEALDRFENSSSNDAEIEKSKVLIAISLVLNFNQTYCKPMNVIGAPHMLVKLLFEALDIIQTNMTEDWLAASLLGRE